jgi:hypothetical protein
MPGRRIGALAGALLALTLAEACSGGSSQSSPPTASPTGTLKQQIAGLLDKSGQPTDPGFDGVLDGYVVLARWADLQPSAGAPIASNNAIDKAIAQVRAYDAARRSHPWLLKLRVTAGIDAPEWAKNIGGPPVTIISDRPPLTGTVGRFWLPAYQAAYTDLQSKLAARYDSVPEIREVVISMCQTVFDEPMIRQISVPETDQNLLAAGYTVNADHACHQAAVRAHLVWHETISYYTFNPYQVVSNNGIQSDETFTEQIQDYCREILGRRCGLENNSIRVPIQAGGYARMYEHMKSLGPPLTFQLADIKKVGDMVAAINLARSYGARSVELPNKYQQVITPDLLMAPEFALRSAATA